MKTFYEVLGVTGAYLLGSLNSAYFFGKYVAHKDLRRVGSGNLGTNNTFKQVGKPWAVLVFLIDAATEALAILVMRAAGASTPWQVAGGLAAIIGHDWPIFLDFMGGRGMAMGLVGTAILAPWAGLAIALTYAIGLFIKEVALMNLFGIALSPIIMWFQGQPASIILFGAGLFAICVARRLQGSPWLGKKSVKENWQEVLWNRLGYDRETEKEAA